MNPTFEGSLQTWRESENQSPDILSSRSLGGGSINQVYLIEFKNDEKVVVKSNSGKPRSFFEKEAHGLEALTQVAAIRTPKVLDIIEVEAMNYLLIMEFIESNGRSANYDEEIGRQLAELHLKSESNQHGFHEDNLIGATCQINNWSENWCEFWINCRMKPQIKWAYEKGYLGRSEKIKTDRFCKVIEHILPKKCKPCMLHGDLWSGNIMSDEQGMPAIIDPATYYGHHEAEFGMIRLFGSQSLEFYQAYQDVYPFEDGYDERMEIYKLYHVLNHLNLFGTSYRSQSMSIIDRFC